MANPGYLRSTDGNDVDDGSTWALANALMTGAITDAVAGDRIWVSQVHAESTGASITLTFPGTPASPNQILCGNDAAEPPTALATTGSVAATATSSILMSGCSLIRGISFTAGTTTANNIAIRIGTADDSRMVLDTCSLIIGGSGTANRITAGVANLSGAVSVTLRSCTFQFANASQGFGVAAARCFIRGGSASASASGTAPSNFLTTMSSPGESIELLVDGFDFSNWGTAINLCAGGAWTQAGKAVFRNCKLATGWTGTAVASSFSSPGFRLEMWNCAAGDINYALWVEDYAGSIKHETTIVRSGGASDGDTPIAWKMATSANVKYPPATLISPEIFVPNTTTAAAKTLTVEIVHDSLTALNNDEVWLDVQYLGTSGFPLSLFADDAPTDVITAAAAQTASAVTWTTTGLTNPNKQLLSVSITPQEEGVYICRVVVAKPSYTVYVDPVVTVT